MLCRREFLGWSAAAVAGLVLPRRAGAAEAPLRTITYNVCRCHGWPERPGNRAELLALRPRLPEKVALQLRRYAPDIITLSEAPEEDAVALMAQALEMNYAFFSSTEGFPGAILTRFELRSSEDRPYKGGERCPRELFTRHFGRALLGTPDGELAVCSIHLHPMNNEVRERECAAAMEVLADDLAAKRSLLLQGDFNYGPDNPQYAQWKAAGMLDTFAAKGSGPDGTVTSADPRRRIDYIWAHGPIAARCSACRVLAEAPFRFDRKDLKAYSFSDHLPVLAEFAGADAPAAAKTANP